MRLAAIHALMILVLCPAVVGDDKTSAIAIDAADKAALEANQDKQVVVSGKIKSAAWSRTGKVMNVEFEDSPLILAVFERSKEAMNQAFEGDAAKKWTGAKVKVSGKLGKYGGQAKVYEGRPQIIVTRAEQVQVVIEPAK